MKSILRSGTHGVEIDFPGGFAVRVQRTRRGHVIIAEFPEDHEASEDGQRVRIRPLPGKSVDESNQSAVA